jgi:hypothetical protein
MSDHRTHDLHPHYHGSGCANEAVPHSNHFDDIVTGLASYAD